MNIIFIGNSKISVDFLNLILKFNFNITVFNKKINKKKFTDDYVDLKKYYKNLNIKIIKYTNLNTKNNINLIKKIDPIYIFSLGSSDIVKKQILKLAKIGVIGFHPTAIPKNRGNHPIIWSIILGLEKSATTFFFLNEKIDDGKIISQKKFNIPKKTNSKKLYKLVTLNGLFQLKKILEIIKNNKKLILIKKNSNKGNYWRKRNYMDGVINWNMSFEFINRHIMALSLPYSGAEFFYNKKRIKIFKIKKIKKNKYNEPGKIIRVYGDKSFDIACYDYELKVIKYSPIINLEKVRYL